MTSRTQVSSPLSLSEWLSIHWFKLFIFGYGLWVILPLLTPIFMQIGWTGSARVIYFIYSLFCHQLPERSFFVFGQKTMYSLEEIQAVWQNTINPLILRKFIGTPEMGWKMAWSDRMISFYGGIWLFSLVWRPLRQRIPPFPWWVTVLFVLPMTVDVGTHFASDFAGIGQGFRDSNLWLVELTGNTFPAGFYAGDALGSFNSWMRLITGGLAALGVTWTGLPFLEQALALPEQIRKIKEYQPQSYLSEGESK